MQHYPVIVHDVFFFQVGNQLQAWRAGCSVERKNEVVKMEKIHPGVCAKGYHIFVRLKGPNNHFSINVPYYTLCPMGHIQEKKTSDTLPLSRLAKPALL